MARPGFSQRFDRSNSVWRWLFADNLPPGYAVDQVEKTIMEAGKLVMWFWFQRILPKKFELGAARRYKFKKRGFKYQKFKQKNKPSAHQINPSWGGKGGQVNPPLPAMVWSGRFKKRATEFPASSPKAKTTRTGFVFSINFRAPTYISLNRHVNMIQEIQFKRADDDIIMARVFESLLKDVFGTPARRSA